MRCVSKSDSAGASGGGARSVSTGGGGSSVFWLRCLWDLEETPGAAWGHVSQGGSCAAGAALQGPHINPVISSAVFTFPDRSSLQVSASPLSILSITLQAEHISGSHGKQAYHEGA